MIIGFSTRLFLIFLINKIESDSIIDTNDGRVQRVHSRQIQRYLETPFFHPDHLWLHVPKDTECIQSLRKQRRT